MGLLQLLSVGAQNLITAQVAQATVGNNAANVATPGYSKRRVSLVENAPIISGSHVLGMGVVSAGIDRLRDTLLDSQFRLDSQDLAFAKTQAGLLDQVGAMLSPADASSLGATLNGLWAAFGDLQARPEDGAVRRTLLSEAQQFVYATKLVQGKLEALSRDTFERIGDRAAEINDSATRLADLNRSIKGRPTDPSLADERDRLVDRLSQVIGVRATVRDDGTVQVVVDGTGILLVDGVRAATITASGTAIGGTVSLTVDGAAVTQAGGEIGALLRVRNSSADGIPYALSTLDTLARGIISEVNRVHASGAGLTLANAFTGSITVTDPTATLATAGLAFPPTAGSLSLGVFDAAGALVSTSSVAVDPATMSLNALATALDALPNVTASVSSGRLVVSATNPAHRLAFGSDTSGSLVALGVNGFFTGTDAKTIGLDATIVADPSLVAAAQADLVAGRVSPGDGRNAGALAAIGQSRILSGGTETPAAFLGGFGGSVGAATRAAQTRSDTLEQVIQAVEAQRQSVSGVNLDEELADMVRFQHAFEASGKFVKTIDEMIRAVLSLV
jgi:flagellar hook-associated protein 1 FlgK